MFDMGFLPDIRRILAALPDRRQNLLFAATMPDEVRMLAEQVLHDPAVAELAHSVPPAIIDHALYGVHQKRKMALLRHLLSKNDFVSAIVFTRTKHRAKSLALQLGRKGHKAVALQGNMDPALLYAQPERIREEVATILAAYGSGTGHVFNLGHGIHPQINPDHVTAFVDAVHELSVPYHQEKG